MHPDRAKLIKEAVRVYLFLKGDWVSAKVAEAEMPFLTSPHFRQIVRRLMEAGEVERKDQRNYIFYRWNGLDLGVTEQVKVPELTKAVAPDPAVTPARTYVNGSMPNGDVDYWKSKTTWGRT